jgi:hypothetical protein
MTKTGASRRASGLKLSQGWQTRMGVSLILGLAFLLCAKASVEDDVMVTFLLGCGRISEGQAFTNEYNPNHLSKLEIDVSRAGEIPPQRHWRNLEYLTSFKIVGPISGDELSGKEVNVLRDILLGANEVPNLKQMTIENMNTGRTELPKGIFGIKGVDDITIRRVTCRRISNLDGFLAIHVKTFTVENFVCEENNFPHLLFGMHNLTSLYITDSTIGDVTSPDKGLSLGNLIVLKITAIEKKSLEDFIKRGGMGNLEVLEIRGVVGDLDNLELFREMKFSRLGELTLASAGIRSLKGFKGKNFPCLRSLFLEGNPGLVGLKKSMRKELEGIESLRMDVDAYKREVNRDCIPLPMLEKLTLTKGDKALMTMCQFGGSKLRVDLTMKEMRREDLKGLQVSKKGMCRDIEVTIDTDGEQQDPECYGDILKMIGRCVSPEILSLVFTTRQESFPDLKFVTVPNKRGEFQDLVSFRVERVNADCIAGIWGMVNWKENSSGIEGTWNKGRGKWDVKELF